MKKINILLLIIIIVSSCNSGNEHTKQAVFINFDWLCGRWINNLNPEVIFYENWTKQNSKLYAGNSYVLKYNDTIFFESIHLINADTGQFYCVAVRNQNKSESVNFKLISSGRQSFTFENKHHDFPQRIVYQYKAPDTLNAWIEGIREGKPSKESFLMWRVH